MPALHDDPWSLDDIQRRTMQRLFRDLPDDKLEESRRRAIRYQLSCLFVGIDYDDPKTVKGAAEGIVSLVNEIRGGRQMRLEDLAETETPGASPPVFVAPSEVADDE